MSTAQYIGNELDLFAHATNWKSYWRAQMAPYLGRRILDVGAGIGGTATVLREHPVERYVALEPDLDNVARMREAGGRGDYGPAFEVVAGTLADLGPQERFDTILYVDVLEHIEQDRAELERAACHLEPGGRVIVLSPAHQWLFSPFDEAVGHVRRYDRRSLLAAKPERLAVERLRYLDSVGLLASAGNRLLLSASQPTLGQIRLWDGVMVRSSRLLDPLLAFRCGKSILASFRKPGLDAR